MSIATDIQRAIQRIPFVDTHEHLMEESDRVALATGRQVSFASPGTFQQWPAADWSWLFSQYVASDLRVAGMPVEDLKKLLGHELAPKEKYRLLAPWYARCRHTGFLQAAQEAMRLLFHVEDLREDNCEQLAEDFRAKIQPGYYRDILREAANLEYTQVNCLYSPAFRETESPDLLAQDISFVKLATELDIPAISRLANKEVGGLDDWHALIDQCFETCGPRAIAVKNQSAYVRKLDYAQVSAAEAAPLFARYVRDPGNIAPEEYKAITDHLFHYCVRKATEYNLPIKLHTGYYADENKMPLHRLRHNAGDVAELLLAHPDARFVIMHIGYPYDAETTALAKHFTNAYVDMCWAWIVNPLAGVRWLKEFLMAAPASKVLTFGGDYVAVESVPGHAAIARKGLSQVLQELVEQRWLAEDALEPLILQLMQGNAHELFDQEQARSAWHTHDRALTDPA